MTAYVVDVCRGKNEHTYTETYAFLLDSRVSGVDIESGGALSILYVDFQSVYMILFFRSRLVCFRFVSIFHSVRHPRCWLPSFVECPMGI